MIIRGEVTRGKRLGHKLGFPTANIFPGSLRDVEDGVYVAKVRLADESYRAVANLGVRPSVTGGVGRLLEVHLFDFSDDLYGREIDVELLQYLRPEHHFADIHKLRAQIALDVGQAMEYFKQQ